MSARVCAVCRAPLGGQHHQCTIAEAGTVVIDAQCVSTTHEGAILWVMYRLHLLSKAGLIVSVGPQISERGLNYAIEHFKRHAPPSREIVAIACEWLFRSKLPNTSKDEIAALTTLILDWRSP